MTNPDIRKMAERQDGKYKVKVLKEPISKRTRTSSGNILGNRSTREKK